ncbi:MULTISPECIES: rhomboid family protein [Flavobacteriaceae]|jgi:membrane associated rhomboid family serine protease|uniref:rhomboid family protein n=1 Tax=Flavobacteriaceae TaxID=49546 RepID=UPI0015C982BC|nr:MULTISPECIES: rhomboid family intramembrane serine protease [Flavobacteriaceae]MBD3892222.1 rhomboid family intramembrane serine protease [Olleya marilimosa]
MEEIGIVTLSLIIANGIVTYKGLNDYTFLDKFSFNVDQILVNKDYKRLITSGFLHADWTHFAFNMITLYLFSRGLESTIGIPAFLILYFASLIGGNLFALYIHRNHPDYTAIGASGAVSGLVFASIGLFPGMEIGFILLPVFIPAWLYGIAYVLYSIYGIKSQRDNIGHEAHLGGGIVGLLVAIILSPNIVITNYLPIILILIPSLTFLFLIIKKPHLLIVENPFSKSKKVFTFEDKYNSNKASKQSELDKILDKINKKGYDKLTKKEKEKLNELSK